MINEIPRHAVEEESVRSGLSGLFLHQLGPAG